MGTSVQATRPIGVTRLAAVVLLIAGAVAVGVVGGFATALAAATPDSSAPNGTGGVRWLVFVVCLGSFAAGYGVVVFGDEGRKAKALRERHAAAESLDGGFTGLRKPSRLRRLGQLLAHVVILIALCLGLFVAVYEAFGMASFHGWSPFTSYVRAATVHAPLWSSLYAGIGSFLVAYWLMPRTTHRCDPAPSASMSDRPAGSREP